MSRLVRGDTRYLVLCQFVKFVSNTAKACAYALAQRTHHSIQL